MRSVLNLLLLAPYAISFLPHPNPIPAPEVRRSSALFSSQLEKLADITTLSIDSGDLKVIEAFAKTGERCLREERTA